MRIETTFDRARRHYEKEIVVCQNPLEHRAITREEHEQLLTQYDPMSPWRLLWEILWDTGLRPFEACKLQIENFNNDFTKFGYKIGKPKRVTRNGVIYAITNTRIIDINSELAKRLKAYVRMSALPYGFIFPSQSRTRFYWNPRSLNKEMKKHREKLGGRWLERNSFEDHLISPHSYRRSWITRYAQTTDDCFELAAAIGHKDPRTSYTYYQFMKHEKVKQFINDQKVVV